MTKTTTHIAPRKRGVHAGARHPAKPTIESRSPSTSPHGSMGIAADIQVVDQELIRRNLLPIDSSEAVIAHNKVLAFFRSY